MNILNVVLWVWWVVELGNLQMDGTGANLNFVVLWPPIWVLACYLDQYLRRKHPWYPPTYPPEWVEELKKLDRDCKYREQKRKEHDGRGHSDLT